ncbi:CHAT domain-containing protein [Spirulina sp. CCNP1310]|uniref:CHAT domain-containing protein n=1 Tax=Spirulina sp. CCNP1310 TaxID=3110249 RepID=UPI002B220ABA|nr:CHAT domain-containing protein [Spirulina sp. CCNP1310]MEA5417611.1 CHAT domain-containing protein [Spirulina sp. CCNP1310]
MGFLDLTVGMVAIACLTPTLTLAQTITPAPDGTGTAIEYQGQTYRITGGTQAGANLFHSFQDFGLNAGQVAQFLSQPGIENILGRVTGGNPSVIQGILQVSGSNAHLYLMNPAGIIFGPGSSLDLSGNFTATTADRIGFEGGWFNAFGPNNYSGLTGNPQQFGFLQTAPGSIINSGDLITSGNLYISAGTILNTGKIEGKHVILAAVPGQSLVQLAQPGMLLRLEVDRTQVQAGITALDLPTLLTGSGVDLSVAVPPGSVVITNTVAGQTVDLMAAERVRPSEPKLIRTGDGTGHHPTVVLFPENLQDPLSVTMIDSRVDQPDDLLYGGNRGTISRLIPPGTEGVGEITATLARVTSPIDKLKIVAEGHQGNIWLGQTWLNADNIQDYQGAMEAWGEQLGPNGALFIYSCFTALGAIGEGFVNTLADLTGVTVAASTNATGSANYGGDWNLEYQTGNVDGDMPFTLETLSNWEGKLATLTVTNADDAGFGSLRERIAAASVGDTVIFDTARTVTLGGTEISWATDNLTIDGNGSTVSGNNASRVFYTTATTTTFQNITITGANGGEGGGILSQGNLTLNHANVSSNSAQRGGGIFSHGTLTLINSTVADNSAHGPGGGIFNPAPSGTISTTVINSTISGNSANGGGGGLNANGMVIINDSIIIGNSARTDAGGIFSQGGATLTNSAVSGNSTSGPGGGINSAGTVTLINSTISDNSANRDGGGIVNIDPVGAVTLTNSTVSGNSSFQNGGGIFSNGTITLTDSTIFGNSASSGGGINSTGMSGVTLTNSTVSGNSAIGRGGGINSNAEVTLTNSMVSGNSSGTDGGGIYSMSGVTLTDSTVSGNLADWGGGIQSSIGVMLTNSTISGNSGVNGGGILAPVVTLTNSTVSGNSANERGGGILNNGAVTLTNSTVSGNSANSDGGGIWSNGAMTLTNSTVSGNSATFTGGGIYTLGVVTLTNSTVSGNSATFTGGGIWSNGEVTLTNSTVSGNSANLDGGGIFSDRAVTLTNSTVFGNSANSGGGMLVTFEAVTLTNSTISGNSASSHGGGIESFGAVTLNNSTIAFNTAGTLGGGLSFSGNNPHSINNTINKTIIANNTAPTGPDVGIWSDTHTFNISHSLILDTSGMNANGSTGIPTNGVNGNIVGLDPLLGPLQNNGGPTQTHALLAGSPAINAGNNALTTTEDQRGQPRISDLIVDMGAYELQVVPPVPPVLPPEPLPENPEPLSENPPIPNATSEGICFPDCEHEEPSEAAVEFVEQLQLDTSERSPLDVGVENIEIQITQEYQNYLGVDPVPEMTLTEAQDMLQRIAKQTGQTPAILYITFVPTGLETSENLTDSLLASAALDDPFPLAQRSIVPAETDELQLVLVTPTGTPILKRLRVNRRQATAAVSQLARAIPRTSGRSYLEPAQELYNWLIAPLRLELTDYQIDHIGIIADTGLRFIPFATLHDGERFLIEQYSVGLMPSLSLTEHTYQSIQGLPVLAMGASEFTDQAPLPAVPLELSIITEQVGTGEKLINEDFTLERLKAARAEHSYRIVHLGTHGEFNPGSPADSYIELWGDRLTLDRIRELSLNNPPVELLVLSACRTALGSNEAELGFAGFALQAGVKSALGSLWYVSDLGTLGLMSVFYRQLQTAPIKAEALRQAQLAMIQGEIHLDGVNLVSGSQNIPLTPELVALGQVDLSHPYYWSAFTLIGSPW